MTGVSCVLLLNSSEGNSDPQILENLMKKLELLGAQKCGRIHVESAVYFSNFARSQCKTFQVLTSTEYPASCFIFTDNQTALVADISFREFPGCLKAFYQRKKKLQVEAKGIKYQLGDFTINFITIFMGQSASVKGYLIEVCFHASCMIHLCRDILKAFITQVLPDICPPANSSTEHIFSPSFLQAVETGTFDAPRWPPSQLTFPLENNFLQDDSPLSHVCVRLTMTQYAEHINVVRRLSRQFVNTPSTLAANDSSYATPSNNSSSQANKNSKNHKYSSLSLQSDFRNELIKSDLNRLKSIHAKLSKQCDIWSDKLVHRLETRNHLLIQLNNTYERINFILKADCEKNGHDTNLKFSMEPRLGDEAFTEWINAVRRMARIGDGLPSAIRSRVWSALANRQLAKQHVDWDHEIKMAFNELSNQDDDRLGEQIVKDLHRTGCEQFGSDSDRASLKRVLLAYARWNKRVGYCQGFNVIAAGVLDVTDRNEKEAFKIMVYLIDYVLPESYFAQNLQALSVDIAVFRQLLQNRLPELANHLDHLQFKAASEMDCQLARRQSSTYKQDILSGKYQGAYEPPLMNVYIIQWFLTLFATCLASDAVLRVWDSILLEGSEVILRTAIVIMDFLKSRLLKLKSADQFYAKMSDLMSEFSEGRIVSSQELLFEIYELAPFPYPGLKELREKFMYNIAPLVVSKQLSLNSLINHNKDAQSVSNNNQMKMSKFNLLKYFPTNFKTHKSSQSDKDNENLTKFKNRKYLNETTGSSNRIKNDLTQPMVTEKRHCDIKSDQCIQSTEERCLPIAELNDKDGIGDNYQEISLTMDMDPEVEKIARNGDDSVNSQIDMTHSKEVVHNKSAQRFSNDQVKGTVKCFSAFWSDKSNNRDSLFSNKSCISENNSMKSSRRSVNETLPGNLFRPKSLDYSPFGDDGMKSNSDISQTSLSFKTSHRNNHCPVKSTSFDSYGTLDNVSDNNLNEIDDISNYTTATTATSASPNDLNKNVNNSSDASPTMCLNQKLIGAVKSWQENADWSVAIDENDDPNVKISADELNSKKLTIKQSNNMKPKLHELAKLNSLEISLPMKYSYSDETLNGHLTLNTHRDHMDYEVDSMHSLAHYKNIYDTNIIYSNKSMNEFILMNIIKQYNQLKQAKTMDNFKESKTTPTHSSSITSNEALSLNDTETSSCITPVLTKSVPKKLPWQEAAYSFALNCRLNNKLHTSKPTCELLPIKTTLTQSRKEFGAKFGIY
ncbi:unnamed protein product [Schistosoma turkestanicum]|nr:unnamed protein product [Schistosoma turkestanicum]